MSEPTKQFWIRGRDNSGQDLQQDLIVLAASFEEALGFWVVYYEEPQDFLDVATIGELPLLTSPGAYAWDEIYKNERKAVFTQSGWVLV